MDTSLIPSFGLSRFFPSRNFFKEFDDYLTKDLFNDFEGYLPKIVEDENKYLFKKDLPGYEKKDIKLISKEGSLEVTAKSESKEKGSRHFSGRFSLPRGIDYSKIPEAKYENGVLEISFEKLPKDQRSSLEKQIEIK